MGLNISEIIPRKEIQLKDLKAKTIAVDAYNTIYQFLTTIRQPDGTPLMDKNKKITSHLSGLLYRNINLIDEGIKLIYVFDGKPNELKFKTLEKRQENKKEAEVKFREAKELEDEEQMRKYSSQFVKITDEIIQQSKELLDALGIPYIEALGEGEAEAAHLAKINKAWASASQDYDSILFGAPKLIRNLTLARKRKTISGYVDVNPELIELEHVLNHLGINKDQLICLGILVGTDFNPGGVKGIGQKRALDIVRKFQFPVKIFEAVANDTRYLIDFNWQDIYHIFHEPECCTEPNIVFKKVDEKKVKSLLLSHDFSEDRIDSALQKIRDLEEKNKQKSLSSF